MTVGNEVYGERRRRRRRWRRSRSRQLLRPLLSPASVSVACFPFGSSFAAKWNRVRIVSLAVFTSILLRILSLRISRCFSSLYFSLIPFTRFSPSQTHTFLSGSLDQVSRCFNFSTRTASRLFQDHHLYFKMSDNGNNDEKSNNSETEVLSSTTAAAATTSPTSLKRPHHEVSKVLGKSACLVTGSLIFLLSLLIVRIVGLKVLERVSASLALFFHWLIWRWQSLGDIEFHFDFYSFLHILCNGMDVCAIRESHRLFVHRSSRFFLRRRRSTPARKTSLPVVDSVCV